MDQSKFPSAKLSLFSIHFFSHQLTSPTIFISAICVSHQTKHLINNQLICIEIAVNLSNAGQDDSSSEEAQSNHHQISNGKPAVPPRPRSISATRGGIISNLVNSKPIKTINGNAFTDDLPCKDNDVANADRKCCIRY